MKTSMKLKTIMRNMDIRHSDYTYYLSRSPKHRLPDGKVYKRRKARTAAWYVDRKDIPAVVNSLPARTEKAKAYKMRMVQGAVQPDLFCGRNIGETVERALFEGCGGRTAARRRSWLGRSIAAGCGCSRPILTDTPQLTAMLLPSQDLLLAAVLPPQPSNRALSTVSPMFLPQNKSGCTAPCTILIL
jgi:hypothetical protein